ncbi:hypothetical protein LGM85_20115 [Burkholderia multivorans]|nr:hypothetical protein [Burkholderia multivorans]
MAIYIVALKGYGMRKRRSPREMKLSHSIEQADDAVGDCSPNIGANVIIEKSMALSEGRTAPEDVSSSSPAAIHELVARQLSIELAGALERISDLEAECRNLQAENTNYQVEISRFNEKLDRRDSDIALLTKRIMEMQRGVGGAEDSNIKAVESLLQAVRSVEHSLLSQLLANGAAARDDFSKVDRKIADIKKIVDVQAQEIAELVKICGSEYQKKNRKNYPFKFVFKSIEKSRRTRELIRLVEESGFFDSRWYSENYPEVASSGVSPVRYFVDHGLFANHDPGPKFNCEEYQKKYADVAKSKIPAFLHFLRHGKLEGRVP